MLDANLDVAVLVYELAVARQNAAGAPLVILVLALLVRVLEGDLAVLRQLDVFFVAALLDAFLPPLPIRNIYRLEVVADAMAKAMNSS